MPLDSNGIWQYTESETAAPFSTVLNRLAGSVSSVLAPFVLDTGWVAVPTTLPSPWVGSLFARKVGSRVEWKGAIEANGTVWGAINNPQTVVAAFPAQFRPIDSKPFLLTSTVAASAHVQFRAVFQSNGQLVIRCSEANYSFGCNVVATYLAN